MRKFICLAVLFFTGYVAQAQYFEVGINSGLMSYIGDIQPQEPHIGSFSGNLGLFTRLNFSPRLAFKAGLNAGEFYATDRYANNSRYRRNLESKTRVYDISATAEYNFSPYNVMRDENISPYVFAGVSGFYFNPQARYEGTWTDLRPLQTEGVGYSPMSFSVPFGLGFKFGFKRRYNFGFEFRMQQTFTDYLDDVSGNYPNLEALEVSNPTAYALSYRTPETYTSNADRLPIPSGQKRGDDYKTDLFYAINFHFSMNLGDRKKLEFEPTYKEFWKQ